MDEKGLKDNEYIREQVKQRPLNKSKLVRRTILTASMAVIFGVLACFTFLILEPVLNNLLYPEEEPEVVRLKEETEEEFPEKLMESDEVETEVPIEQESGETDSLAEFVRIKESIDQVVSDCSKAMVNVTTTTVNEDMWGEKKEDYGQAPGVIVADNGISLLILSYNIGFNIDETVDIIFADNTVAEGNVMERDTDTGLCVVGVPLDTIPEETRENITVASLDNSKANVKISMPVIVLGNPYGVASNIATGMITTCESYINMTDSNFQLLTTDIYASTQATGVFFNLQGKVIGIVNNNHTPKDSENLLSALGISDLKQVIERMSNKKQNVRLGIIGMDVTEEANKKQGIPLGAYVKNVVMNSPAMNAGIQSGDVIIGIGDKTVSRFETLRYLLEQYRPGETVDVKISRQGQQEYRDIKLKIVVDEG